MNDLDLVYFDVLYMDVEKEKLIFCYRSNELIEARRMAWKIVKQKRTSVRVCKVTVEEISL